MWTILLVLMGFSLAFCAGAVVMGVIASGKIADLEGELARVELERVK